MKPMTIEQKFWRNVIKSDGCWEWSGTKHHFGYGVVFHSFDGGKQKQYRAHRICCMLHNKDVPEGMVVMHTCDNPACVNPSHLVVGTQAQNLADMHSKGRHKIDPEKVRGEASGMAKLNDETVREIRVRYATKLVSQSKLAQEYGVGQSIISSAIRRETWRHVK